MSGETLEAIGIHEILAALPHRYPFLLVDRIIEIRGDEHGIGIKNVTANEPQFVGHFPNNPVMPGVLVLEGMAQTAGTLCIRAMPGQTKPALVYFLTIDNAKFRKPVIPGDVLEYHMTRIKRRKNMWWFRGEAKVGGEIVADAARLADDVEVGPFCTIGPNVELRAGVRLLSHVNVSGVTTIGEQTAIYPFASLGTAPQSTGYRGGATRLNVGRS